MFMRGEFQRALDLQIQAQQVYPHNYEAFLNTLLIRWNMNQINDQELFDQIILGDIQLGTRTSEVLTCFAKTALGYNFNSEE